MTHHQVQIASKLKPLFRPKRTKVFYGGRGGLKSWGFSQALLIIAGQSQKRVLCARELQLSIQESVHKLLSDTIPRIGQGEFYDIQKTQITGLNGSQFIFEGVRNNPKKIKSMEGIDICWVEEAEAVSDTSWDLLIPTIRKPGSEIWVSFNPDDAMDATYRRFVTPYLKTIEKQGYYEDDEILVVKTSWRDNPWFSDELRAEKDKCKRENYAKYLHIWEGQCNADYADSIIKPEWVEAAINAHERLGFKPEGIRAMGFDPADEGQDDKAYAMRHGVVVQELDAWGDGDVADAIDRVFERADDARCDELVYDGIGIGAAVKVKVQHKDPKSRLEVSAFIASHSPDNPDQRYKEDRPNEDVFRNKRAQYWWYLRDRFEATYQAVEKGKYVDPDELISISADCRYIDQLKSELVRVQRKRGANTRVQVESKEDMRKREMPSPNLADALVMAFANPDSARLLMNGGWVPFDTPIDYGD